MFYWLAPGSSAGSQPPPARSQPGPELVRQKHTRQHNKQVQSTTLFESRSWVTSSGQIWCVCCNMYYITEIYGREGQPECWVNVNIMFPVKIAFYWGAVLWELSLLRRHTVVFQPSDLLIVYCVLSKTQQKKIRSFECTISGLVWIPVSVKTQFINTFSTSPYKGS